MKTVKLKQGTIHNQTVLNDFNTQIRDNFNEILQLINDITSGGGIVGLIHTIEYTIAADTPTTISGELFTTQITSEPRIITIYKDGIEQQGINKDYVVNGDYFDIVLTSTDEIIDAQINVLC